MEITIKFPNLRYLNDLVGCRCAPDLLALGLFPNAKEVTESFACYRAAKMHAPFALSDPDVGVVVVGDGGTPRTAAVFALRSAWKCYSVDPALNVGKIPTWAHSIDRLHCRPMKVEEFGAVFKKVVIVLPHSHAPLEAVLDRVKGDECHVVALPCCTDHKIAGRLPDVRYDDWGVHSQQRVVMVWNNV